MGVDHSKLKGLQVDKNAVEVNDFWSLHNAEIPNEDNSTLLSVFQEEPFVNGQLWITQTPLQRSIKNLMIYRHPCILKYITSWDQGSKKFLATERCQPLSILIQSQTDIQICLGLKNILSSLIFLIEQAKARHLNICMSSIFVNNEGEWRLGGFEYVWKSKDITKHLLDLTKSFRYNKSIDTNENKNDGDCIEQYAFAVFCEELLKNRKNSDTPYVQEFYDYCLTHLKHQNISMRPKLSAVLLHPYFNHEFILIHSFLNELPLKGLQDKQDFFTGLIDRLRYFDENVVASQIGNLLLSRMVLLDTTAQLCVTPYVLKTKTDISSALFSHSTYTKYIIPRIKQIFCVRDAQIRLILLEYFNEYVKLLTKEELKEQILPNLLLGIKDTNDILVAKTLRCLADLVPILGSKIVIGSNNRKRLFADGRPQGLPDCTSHWVEPRSITPVITSGEFIASASPLPPLTDNNDTISESFISMTSTTTNNNNLLIEDNLNSNNNILIMPERLSPDGGEDIQTAATDGDLEEEDAWSDWENDEIRQQTQTTNSENDKNNDLITNSTTVSKHITDTKVKDDLQKQLPIIITPSNNTITEICVQKQENKQDHKLQLQHQHNLEQNKSPAKIIDDINELDIKNQKLKITQNNDEIDFFKDMEPVIQKSTNNLIIPQHYNQQEQNLLNLEKIKELKEDLNKSSSDELNEIDKSRFAFKLDYIVDGDDDGNLSSEKVGGWDCDGDWGDDD